MSPREIHDYLTRLCIEAGADPTRARERMAQAAMVVVAEMDACSGDGERMSDEDMDRADAERHGDGCSCLDMLRDNGSVG